MDIKKYTSYVLYKDEDDKRFDYFPVFDNNLAYLTENWIETKTKISTLELDLLDNKRTTLARNMLNGMFIPLMRFVSDETRSGTFVLIDFSYTGVQFNNIEEILDLPKRYETVYFYHMGNSLTDELLAGVKKRTDILVNQINGSLLSMWASGKDENVRFKGDEDVHKIIQDGLSNLIFNMVSEDEEPTMGKETNKGEEKNKDRVTAKEIVSSNVVSNHYVNMRRLFADSGATTLVVSCLLRKMMDVKNLEFDAFVCSSITGACIASYLSVYIKKPVLFLRNVGPDIKTEDDLIVERIYPHKKYVYIFDFMCLGTEYSRTKLICALKNSTIIMGFGISHYKKPKPSKEDPADIHTLFSINQFDENYYKCAVNESDLNKIIK